MITAALIIFAIVIFIASMLAGLLAPGFLYALYGVGVFLLVDLMTRKLAGRIWASRLIAALAAALRGVIAAWVLYLVSFLVTDLHLALTYTHAAVIFASLGAMFPVALVLRACEVSENTAVPYKEGAVGPVVLFLRSFTTDGLFHEEADFFFGTRARSDEEDLADVLRNCRLGDFVALAHPGQRVQELGPDRLDIDGRDWKDVVSDLLSRANAVIMRLGTSESMLWELDAVVRSKKLHRTLLLLPVAHNEDDLEQKYRSVLSLIPDQPPYPAFPPKLEKDARFLFFDEQGSSCILTDPGGLTSNVAKRIAPFLNQLGVTVPKKRVNADNIVGILIGVSVGIYAIVWLFLPRFLQ